MAERAQKHRVVFLDHTAVLSGAELCLLDLVPEFPRALVCVFENGPLVAELRARGVRVEVLESSSRVADVRRGGGWLAAMAAVPGVGRLVRSLERLTTPDDVLYANSQKSWIVAALLAWWHGRTVIWHLHDIISGTNFSPLLARTAIALANRLAAAVIANSSTTADAFVAAGGRRSLIHVVHNGIDSAPFNAVTLPQLTARKQELGSDSAPLTIGLFGRIAPWKGQHVMLEALAELPEAQVVVVGAPLFGEHDYCADLERRAREPAVAGRVKMLGFRQDVAALMQAVDIVVHTSIEPEPFGRVIVEAMLAHRPVVATAMGGALEIVADGVDGLLVAPADPRALAAVIRGVAANPEWRAALVAAGYRKAIRQFSLGAMRRRISAVVAAARRRQGRVVLVSHTAEPSGAELSLIDIAGHLGDEAVVCLFQHGPIEEPLKGRGVAVEVFEGRRSMLRVRSDAGVLTVVAAVPAVLAQARRLARLVGPDDVLYANSQKAWIVAALVAWRRGRPVVWHLRDILSAAHFGVAQRAAVIGLANRLAARVVVNSVATGEAFVAMGGRRDLLRVVHNGIDEAPFIRLRQGRSGALRRDLGLEYPVIVGLFGRLARWKGQHILLEALRHLDGVAALIVGEALFGEWAYLEELRALAAAPALADRVRLLGHRSDVPELMNAVDIIVHASIEPEPFGRVIVEGMLAERPVIATGAGGVAEIITDGVDGVLVPPNDADALAAAIRSLAADPARAQRLAAAGYEKARRRFVLGVMQRRLAVVLDELVPAEHARSTGQPCA